MVEEPYYQKREREAAEKLEALLALPIDTDNDMSTGERFDPWDMFPGLYGTYCSTFDKCAIDVLTEILKFGVLTEGEAGHKVRDDLGAEMFREMLCTAGLCEYGTSPRVCFPSSYFRPLLPKLIEKWKAYSAAQWRANIADILEG